MAVEFFAKGDAPVNILHILLRFCAKPGFVRLSNQYLGRNAGHRSPARAQRRLPSRPLRIAVGTPLSGIRPDLRAHGRREPMLPSETLWRLPEAVPHVPEKVVPGPMSEEELAFLRDRKAASRD